MASDDGQAEIGEPGAELGRVNPETDAGVGAGVVVGGFEVGEPDLCQAFERSPGILGKRIAHGVELQANTDVHRGSSIQVRMGASGRFWRPFP